MAPLREALSGVDQTPSKLVVEARPLTRRELQVITLICDGRTTKQIASLLNIGVKTADSHRTRLMQKLDIHSTAGLVRYAIRQGLIEA
jgi:DNA-binding NarL/FixJ family response regulator